MVLDDVGDALDRCYVYDYCLDGLLGSTRSTLFGLLLLGWFIEMCWIDGLSEVSFKYSCD